MERQKNLQFNLLVIYTMNQQDARLSVHSWLDTPVGSQLGEVMTLALVTAPN